MSKIIIIETQTTHMIKYAVKSDSGINNGELQNLIDTNQIGELHQSYIGEKIIGRQEMTDDEFEKFCKQNDVIEPIVTNLDVTNEEPVIGDEFLIEHEEALSA